MKKRTADKSGASEHLAVLDGLRGIAILLVLAFHALEPFWNDFPRPFLRIGPFDAGIILISGWIGVDLFFVLSGFLIGSQLLTRHFGPDRRPIGLWIYFKRRLLRIFPTYFVVMTLMFVLVYCLQPAPMTAATGRYFVHLLMLYDFFFSPILEIFWSLAIEIKFYLLAPLLLFLILRLPGTGQRLAAAAALVAMQPAARFAILAFHDPAFPVSWEDFSALRSLFFSGSDGLLAGIFCGIAYTSPQGPSFVGKVRIANALFFGGIAVITAVCARPLYFQITLLDEIFCPFLLACGFCAIMAGLLGGCAGSHLFTGQILRFFARISYSLYLLHIPVMISSLQLIWLAFPTFHLLPPSQQFLVFLPVSLGLSTIIAALAYREIEAPFIRLSHQSRRAAASD